MMNKNHIDDDKKNHLDDDKNIHFDDDNGDYRTGWALLPDSRLCGDLNECTRF